MQKKREKEEEHSTLQKRTLKENHMLTKFASDKIPNEGNKKNSQETTTNKLGQMSCML